MRAAALVGCGVLLGTHVASADNTSSVGITASARLGPISGEAVFPQLNVTLGHIFWDRLHLAATLGVGRGVAGLVEAGLQLQASPSMRLLINWRIGGARLVIDDMTISTTVVELAPELRFHATKRIDVRVAPFILSGYWSNGLWHGMFGPEVGMVVGF